MLDKLKSRFEANMNRHPSITWEDVQEKLTDKALAVITKMDETGGEPDVIVMQDGRLAFVDCCLETTDNRRSLCLDQEAWDKRKNNKQAGNVTTAAAEIGVPMMNEEEYLHLQSLGDFDIKGQVWLKTPEDFRKKGEGLFGNKRHGRTFVYYNGADSYYRTRGFRTIYYL